MFSILRELTVLKLRGENQFFAACQDAGLCSWFESPHKKFLSRNAISVVDRGLVPCWEPGWRCRLAPSITRC